MQGVRGLCFCSFPCRFPYLFATCQLGGNCPEDNIFLFHFWSEVVFLRHQHPHPHCNERKSRWYRKSSLWLVCCCCFLKHEDLYVQVPPSRNFNFDNNFFISEWIIFKHGRLNHFTRPSRRPEINLTLTYKWPCSIMWNHWICHIWL